MAADGGKHPSARGRIVVSPEILSGTPVVKGTRIPASLILNLIAHGYAFDRIRQAYPIVDDADIRAAAYANLSPETAHFLTNTFGFDIASLLDLGLGHLRDVDVVALAQREGQVIVTFDLDLGEIYH